MALGIKQNEIRKIVALIMLGVFVGLVIVEIRDWLILHLGSPLLVGVVGLAITAYLYEIR